MIYDIEKYVWDQLSGETSRLGPKQFFYLTKFFYTLNIYLFHLPSLMLFNSISLAAFALVESIERSVKRSLSIVLRKYFFIIFSFEKDRSVDATVIGNVRNNNNDVITRVALAVILDNFTIKRSVNSHIEDIFDI